MAQYSDGIIRLKKRAKSAAREISRLQADNHKMSATLKDVLGDKKKSASDTAILIDSDRDKLRNRIEGYIATIDRILEEG